jgi:hypothetical protein
MGYLHTPILEHVKFRYVEIHTCKLLILKIMKLSDKQIAVAKDLENVLMRGDILDEDAIHVIASDEELSYDTIIQWMTYKPFQSLRLKLKHRADAEYLADLRNELINKDHVKDAIQILIDAIKDDDVSIEQVTAASAILQYVKG